MRLANARATVPDVPNDVLGYARRYASEPAVLNGTDNELYSGYLLRKNVSDNFMDVKILDIPGKVLSVDAYGYSPKGYSPATYSAGFRHPWRPSTEYTLPDEADVDTQDVPVASFGASTAPGRYPTQTVSIDYTTDSFGGTSVPYPITTRGGGATTPNGGFWRSQFESETPLGITDFYPFGDPNARPPHWLSIVSGYGTGQSLVDVRISQQFIQQFAPGYYFMPPSNGGRIVSGLNGGQGGTWPMASACRRLVDGVDTLAVAIPVANTSYPDFIWEYDVGESGLLLLQFTVEGGNVAVLRHHLFEVNSLDPDMQIDPYAHGEGDVYLMNNANLQSVVIADTGDLFVYGAWLTSKWVPEEDLGSGQSDGPGSVPIIHWYRAALADQGATFSKLRTSVYVSAAKDYGGWLSLDDDPTSLGIAVPLDVQAVLGVDGLPGAAAMCRQFARSGFVYGGAATNVVGRNYVDDPVVAYTFEANAFTSIGSIYQTTHRYLSDGVNPYPFWSHYPPWFGACAYDLRQVVFCGFDQGPDRAKRVRFVAVDIFTGTAFDDVIPSYYTGADNYAITPKVNTYQVKLFLAADRTEVASEFAGILSYITTGASTVAHTAAYIGNTGWSDVPGLSGHTGVHYLGNGFFGQCARRFSEVGF